MTAQPKQRGGLMERLFPTQPQAAHKARSKIAELQALLDEAGLTRKEVGKLKTAKLSPKAKALIEDVNARVDEMLSTIVESPSEGLRGKILQAIIAEVAGGAAEEALIEDVPLEEMAVDEDAELPPMDDETKEFILEAMLQIKSLAKDNNQLTEDMGEMVKAMTDMARAFKSIKEDGDTFKRGLARLDALERKQMERPRFAARAFETEVDLPDAIANEIKSSTDAGTKTELGVRVKS